MVVEGLAALSLASSVIQFVDFTSKLISKSKEYYNSSAGALEENISLQDASDRFRSLARGLEQSSNRFSSSKTLNREEEALRQVVQECQELARELRGALERLKVAGPKMKLKSFRQDRKYLWIT